MSSLPSSLLSFTSCALVAGALAAARPAAADELGSYQARDLTLSSVPLRAGVDADLHLRVLERTGPACNATGTALALHGATGAASNYEPLAAALLSSERAGQRPCRIVALDLPGHAGSVARGVPFGQLTLGDYVAAARGALERLPAYDLQPSVIMGHSQGGLVVQMLQQQLVDEGSSLRDAHGVHDAFLFSAVPPRAVAWAFPSTPIGQLLAALQVTDPVLGTYIDIPDAVWPAFIASRLDGTLAPSAPTAAEIALSGWRTPEPLFTIAELIGAPPFARPEVARGVFAPGRGTQLQVIAFAEDSIILMDEQRAMYEHLADDVVAGPGHDGFLPIAGPEAVHGMLLTRADLVVDALIDAHLIH